VACSLMHILMSYLIERYRPPGDNDSETLPVEVVK